MSFKIDLEALILASLQEGPKHGYDIAKTIRQSSQELVKIGEGRLYPALHGLEEEGLITAEWIVQEGKPSRKVYALTEKGLKEFEKKKALWEKFAQNISAIMSPAVKEGYSG